MEDEPAFHKIVVDRGGLSALLSILQPQHPLNGANNEAVFDTISMLSSHSKFDLVATRAGVIGMLHVMTKRRRSVMIEASKHVTMDFENETDLQTLKYAED